MVVEPSATAMTTPSEETVATARSEIDQETVTPGITVPPASFTVAVSVDVSPIDEKLTEVALNPMVDATWLTVAVAVALPEPDMPEIVAVPLATAVTSPVDETVATSLCDEVHVTSAPGTPTPPTVTVAVSWAVSER